MARRRDPDDTPPWLWMLRQPGVIEVLACLYNHGPATYTALCSYVEPGGRGRVTVRAVRSLAAWRMCRRLGTCGTWDEPVPPECPETVYELTQKGRHFALALATGSKLVEQLPATYRRATRRYR